MCISVCVPDHNGKCLSVSQESFENPDTEHLCLPNVLSPERAAPCLSRPYWEDTCSSPYCPQWLRSFPLKNHMRNTIEFTCPSPFFLPKKKKKESLWAATACALLPLRTIPRSNCLVYVPGTKKRDAVQVLWHSW